MEVSLLVLGVLFFGVLLAFAFVVAIVKLLFFVVFFPLKVAFRLLVLPFQVGFALLLLPLFAIVFVAVGIGVLASVFAISLPLLPFAIIAYAVWVMSKRAKPSAAPPSTT